MNTMTALEKALAAVASHSFTLEEQEDGSILVKNNKRENAAIIKDGHPTQLYGGSRNKCGSLVRNDIKKAISE